MTTLALLDGKRDNFFVDFRQVEFPLAGKLGNFDSASKENLDSLLLSDLLPVLEEVLHAAVVGVLEEILEALLNTELLVSVGKHANVDH